MLSSLRWASTRTLLIICAAALVHQQAVNAQATPTSASLNDPASATGTASGSNSSAVSPSSTSIVPVPLSQQQVPYLLRRPPPTSSKNQARDVYFTGCSHSSSAGYVAAENRINISSIYMQIDGAAEDSSLGNGYRFSVGTLRLVGIGTLGNESYAFNSYTDSSGATTGLLSAIQVSTFFTTFPVFSNYTFLCDRLYPTQNDSVHPNVNPPSCQFGPGTVAFGIDIPLNSTYEAGTLVSEIRLTDSSSPARTIACVQVRSSPFQPSRWYWKFIFWFTIAIVIASFFQILLATLVTSETSQRKAFKNRAREGSAPKFIRDRLGPLIVSGLSGRGTIASPALLRFVTPGCFDIILHLQFVVAIAMCNVQWPDFAYPFLRQVAWSSLLGNVTLTQPEGEHINPLSINTTLPAGDIGAQMTNASSPLYLNNTQANRLLNLDNTENGMETYANIIGLSSQHLFGTCLSIFMAILAAIVVAAFFAWILDRLTHARDRVEMRRNEKSSPVPLSPGNGLAELDEGKTWDRDKLGGSLGNGSVRHGSRFFRSGWTSTVGLHGKALHGNFIRAIVLFHLPVTIVSVYQMAFAHQHSTESVALAALAFAVFSVFVPFYVVVRVMRTKPQKLYEHIGTLLAVGPVYHLYAPGSQLFYAVSFAHSLILGIVVGAGQGRGIAQAVVILIVEVMAALATSLWLPWGEGAMMGPLSFMANVLRIISAILLLLLADLLALSFSARSWLAYTILLLQGIYLLGALLVFLTKLVEAIVRVIWRVRFDERLTARTAGLGGAFRTIERRKMKKKGHQRQTSSTSVKMQRLKLEHRRSDGSTNTMSHMLAHPQPIPMSDARTGSHAHYLGQGTVRPSSMHLSEEGGHIMAALPPMTPDSGITVPTPPAHGFVRTGGGRASDANPYAALPRQDRTSQRPPMRPRPQSQSGVVGTWHPGMMDPRASYSALAKTPSHELSSTQVAALVATKSLQDRQQHGHPARKEPQQQTNQPEQLSNIGPQHAGGTTNAAAGVFPWTKARPNQGGGEAIDDDWSDDEGTTWDSNARNKGAWSGVAKMSAALSKLRRNLMGAGDHTPVSSEADDEGGTEAGAGSLPPSGSGGFEVVRAVRPRVPPNNEATPAAAQDSSAPFPTQSGNGVPTPGTRGSTDASAMYNNQLHQHFNRGSLGMLGADLQPPPSSAGHSEEEAGEDKFWLPPIDVGTTGKEGDLLG